MGRKRLPPDDPREWISRAKSNLALARTVNPDVDLEDLCFDAQQAAEKSVKAVFIRRGETARTATIWMCCFDSWNETDSKFRDT